MGAISYLTTSIQLLREIMPHYGIFVMNACGGINNLTTSIVPLSEIMSQYGIFVMNGLGVLSYLTTSILPLPDILPNYGIFVMIGGGRIKLSDQFYSAPSRNYAPLWYICHDWWWGL